MYKWYIKILLNNGEYIKGYVNEDLTTSNDVAIKYFQGDFNSFSSIWDNNINNCTLYYIMKDVSAFWISVDSKICE